MRDSTTWLCATAIIIALIVAVAWVFIATKPRYATGYELRCCIAVPWCESLDERACPVGALPR